MRQRWSVDVNPFKGENGSYLLGYFTGDGVIRKVNTRVDGTNTYEVYITSGDSDILEEMLEEYNGDAKIQIIHNGKLKKDYKRLSTYNRNVSRYLLELGFEQKNKRGSNVFNSLDDREKWKFLRGLMDSDGSVYQTGYLDMEGMVSVSSQAYILVYEELAEHIDKFLTEQTIYHSRSFRTTKDGYKLVKIYIKGRSTWDFRENIYRDCGMYLKRKKDRLDLDKTKVSFEEAKRLNLNIKHISRRISPEIREKEYK